MYYNCKCDDYENKLMIKNNNCNYKVSIVIMNNCDYNINGE